MSRRNNNERMMGGAHKPEHADPPPQVQRDKTFDPLHFVAPTEFVELPSNGKGYPEGHPLHGEASIEIRYMTAKDEDILSSQTLLKKGIAIERFLQNIIVDPKINAKKRAKQARTAPIKPFIHADKKVETKVDPRTKAITLQKKVRGKVVKQKSFTPKKIKQAIAAKNSISEP